MRGRNHGRRKGGGGNAGGPSGVGDAGGYDAELDGYEEGFRSVMRKAWGDHGWVPVHDETPLDELLNAEPEWDVLPEEPEGGAWRWPSREQPDLELSHLKLEEARQVAAWARQQQARWIAGDGIHPFRIVQRFYALCAKSQRDLIGPLSFADLATMLGQTRAAFQAIMRRLFDDPGRVLLGMAVKVGGQKPESAKEKYAANAKKHKPRRMLKGGASLSAAERRAAEAAQRKAQGERLKALRAKAEARDLERDAEAFRLRMGGRN